MIKQIINYFKKIYLISVSKMEQQPHIASLFKNKLRTKFPGCLVEVSDQYYYTTTDDLLRKMLDIIPIKHQEYVAERHDCLPYDTILLNEDLDMINICDVKVGDFIVGKEGKITKVLNKISKDKLKTLKIKTRRGILECTPNHKVWIIVAGKEKEIFAKDLKINHELLSIKNIDYNLSVKQIKSKEFYELLGYYIADGWKMNNQICISGRDGHPKEKQKERCKNICNKLGYFNTIHYKHIYINPKQDLNIFNDCGTNAHNKQVNNYYLSQKEIKSLLKGLQADCSKASKSKSITYNTVSDKLIIDIRILHKLLGESMSLKFQENCGGFTNSSIWRGTPYLHKEFKNKVLSIGKGRNVDCYDITTKNKGIYLVQSDTVVHNCDDFAREMWTVVRKLFPLLAFGYCHVITPQGKHAANFVFYQNKKNGPINFYFVEPQTGKLSYFNWKPYIIIL